MPAENRIPRGNRSDTDPSLANPAMVHNVVTPSDRQTSPSPPNHQSTNTTSQRCSTPLAKATSPVGLQSLRQGFLQSNISGKATEIILHSWSVGTQKQYQPYLRRWFEFCVEQQASPYSPSVTTVLDFLVRLHEQGLTYTTLNTARSAISALTVSTDRTPIGSHPIVSRFMKGIYKCTPPMPRYQSTWDVQPVLSYLSGLSPMEKLDLKTLTLKVTMLVALVSAQRSQTLHMLNINFMKDTSSCFEFVLPAHIKQSRPGYRPQPVMLHAYPHDKSLCVYSYLTEYLKRTQPLRGKKKLSYFLASPDHTKQFQRKLCQDGFELLCPLLELMLHHSNHTALGLPPLPKPTQHVFQWTRFCARQAGPRLDHLIDSTINQSNPPPLHQQYYILSNF